MKFFEWEPTYRAICDDFGFDPSADDLSVRILEAVTPMLDLDDEDCLSPLIGDTVTVIGDSPQLESDLRELPPEGCIISAGSATERVVAAGIRPDIVVTDLDGPIEAQIGCSRDGAVTLILAHGDNQDLVRAYAPQFRGKVVLTTQGKPSGNVLNFGGFTDGDRSVCLARHFGASRIILLGFDFSNPSTKDGSDPQTKLRKLSWAKRIIFDGAHNDIVHPRR
ncbi:putative Rossmann fold enzyme [Thermoplasmatales archaeon BRNA1]|nr:putative Rossmann fold enzyme [Thermoplasmatales archaeon BRNA1]